MVSAVFHTPLGAAASAPRTATNVIADGAQTTGAKSQKYLKTSVLAVPTAAKPQRDTSWLWLGVPPPVGEVLSIELPCPRNRMALAESTQYLQ